MFKGIEGAGVNIPESQDGIFSAAGMKVGFSGVWHLQLSEEKHVFLTRLQDSVHLVFKEFKTFGPPTSVFLNRKQGVDFAFGLPDLLCTVRRGEIVKVRILFYYFILYKPYELRKS